MQIENKWHICLVTAVNILTIFVKAVAELSLPVNMVVLVPLTENMPDGKATKPGDVVTAMNGKTIQVSDDIIWLHYLLNPFLLLE